MAKDRIVGRVPFYPEWVFSTVQMILNVVAYIRDYIKKCCIPALGKVWEQFFRDRNVGCKVKRTPTEEDFRVALLPLFFKRWNCQRSLAVDSIHHRKPGLLFLCFPLLSLLQFIQCHSSAVQCSLFQVNNQLKLKKNGFQHTITSPDNIHVVSLCKIATYE